jgi:hypothetical protein
MQMTKKCQSEKECKKDEKKITKCVLEGVLVLVWGVIKLQLLVG